ncbi:MAG: HAD family hydrolase [Pseudomonadota bacterium]
MKTKIIAMWSGPRNLSTAMMRSFGARQDCACMDEPFYAASLQETGMDHPMRDEIIADGETDPHKVVEQCLNPATDKPISYQKHMMHHMHDFPLDWVRDVTNVFLIREPERVLKSYSAKWEQVTAADIGYAQQRRLFDDLQAAHGTTPVVIEASDIRANPEGILKALCSAIDIPFDPAMLRWAAGPKPEDGIWAKHWYDAVWASTRFAPPDDTPLPLLDARLQTLADEARLHYDALARHKLKA